MSINDDQTTLLDVPTDERCGKPSASGAPRWFRCPGSERLIRSLPADERDTSTDDSRRGDRIHSALECGRLDGLTDEEKDTAIACQDLERDARENWMALLGHDPADGWMTDREERIWDPERRVSGKADIIHYIGNGDGENNHALILDYKTGRADVEPTVGNLQLRTMAWLLWVSGPEKMRRVQSVTVGIVQPLATKRVNLVKYSEVELKYAERDILRALDATDQFDAPFKPGTIQCEYCPARKVCTAAQNALEDSAGKADLPALPNERLAFLLDRWGVVKKLGKDLEDEAKRRLADPKTRIEDQWTGVGFELKPGGTTRTIADPQKAYARLAHSLPVEAFTECATIQLGKLVDVYARENGISKAEARRTLDDILDDVMEHKERAPSLKRYNPHLIQESR